MSSRHVSESILLYERALARLVVATVVECTPLLGRPPSSGYVAAVLTGSIGRAVVETDGYRVGTFGLMSRFRRQQIHEFLRRLVSVGVLDAVRDRKGLVTSARGRALLEAGGASGELDVPLGLIPEAVAPLRLDVAIRSGLVDSLRRYRAERAHAEDEPEYKFFTEATLRALAAELPRSELELARVPGLGPKRLAAHGPELLRIVAEHLPIIDRISRQRSEAGDEVEQALALG